MMSRVINHVCAAFQVIFSVFFDFKEWHEILASFILCDLLQPTKLAVDLKFYIFKCTFHGEDAMWQCCFSSQVKTGERLSSYLVGLQIFFS